MKKCDRKDCFAYDGRVSISKDAINTRLTCTLLTDAEFDTENCPFYKHYTKVNFAEIVEDIRKYKEGHTIPVKEDKK